MKKEAPGKGKIEIRSHADRSSDTHSANGLKVFSWRRIFRPGKLTGHTSAHPKNVLTKNRIRWPPFA